MLPKFAQIVNRLYAFIYETKHSKSGLGLPSIVALVMTIDKSWTTISNRNSDEFLDGLFAFIKHCEPLLHPITQKIRCPCSRCCNRDDKFVTLKTLEVHISSHGFDQHYTAWKYHGEPTLPLPPPVPHSPEHIDMDAFFEDISANNVPTPPKLLMIRSRLSSTQYMIRLRRQRIICRRRLCGGERTHDEWNELVDWFSHPNQVSRSMKNAANRAKNTIPTHQGKKSFAQGRNEYKVEKGHHEDLIQTWKKTHSNSKTGQFKYEENKQRYLKMKAMQDQIRAGVIPYKTDQEILDEVVPSDNRQNMSGMGRKLPGGGSTSRRRANQAFADVMTREQMTQILRQKEQENELLRKQAEEAQQRAYLAALKADAADQRASAAYQNTETMYGADNDKSKDYAKGKARLGNFESSKGVVVKKTKREVGEASSKDDVETRFNRLGRNDDGLPEEEPDKFQVFRSVCKPTGRMKETRLTTDVMQAVVWLYYKNSPEVDAESWLTEEYDSSIFILNISFSMIILISCNLSQRLADTWERVFPACLIHKRSLNHFGLDGEMYYGQLEEILELTYIGHRKVVLFRCKWEFHKNNQYILATQVTQVFYLQDLARQPRGWKVVEHVYHRDVAESDQDVIHGSSSSHVTLSVGLTNLEHTDLSINAQSTEVDAPPVNDDNANANEDGCLDDDEVNPSTNVEEMACLAPRSHGGDAGGSPPRQPIPAHVPAQCQKNELLRKQAEEAQQRAYLAALKADAADQRASAAYQNTETMYGAVVYRPTINSNLASSSNPQNELSRYITNPHMNDARSIEQLAQDNARGEDNNESASGEDEEGEQHSSDGDYSSESE
ncbi:zinc finger, CCHC-type containing protein [Tanacetum coccineum]